MESAIGAAAAVGDDRLQKMSTWPGESRVVGDFESPTLTLVAPELFKPSLEFGYHDCSVLFVSVLRND